MTTGDAVLKARALWGEDAYALPPGRNRGKCYEVGANKNGDGVFGMGRTWAEAFRNAQER